MTNWLEVSLTVNGELAEAVADVLARFAPDGVVTERDVKFTHAEGKGILGLAERGAGGVNLEFSC